MPPTLSLMYLVLVLDILTRPVLLSRALRVPRSAPRRRGGSGTGGVVRVSTGDKPAERYARRRVPNLRQATPTSRVRPA